MRPKIVIINPDAPDEIVKTFKKIDIEPIAVPLCADVLRPIAGHPDMQIFRHKNKTIVRNDMPVNFLELIDDYCDIETGSSKLCIHYPFDISYNVFAVDNIFFHLTAMTDECIHRYIKQNGFSIINVKQGYSGCSSIAVNHNNVITSDVSIKRACEKNNINAVCIKTGGIMLPGMSHGFIGGCAGICDNDIYFSGILDNLSDKNHVLGIINKCGKNIVYLSDYHAVDYGSFIFY